MSRKSSVSGSTTEFFDEPITPGGSPAPLVNPMGDPEEEGGKPAPTVSRYWLFDCPGVPGNPPKFGGGMKYLAYYYDPPRGVYVGIVQNSIHSIIAQTRIIPKSHWTKIDTAEFHRKLLEFREEATFGEAGVHRRNGLTWERAAEYRRAAREGRLDDIPTKMYKYRQRYYDTLAEEGEMPTPVPETKHHGNPITYNGDSATNNITVNNYNYYYATGNHSRSPSTS